MSESIEVIPDVRADFNIDGRVNEEDYAMVIGCFAKGGPDVSYNGNPACLRPDLNGDGFVDLEDIAGFQNCFSGGEYAVHGCEE